MGWSLVLVLEGHYVSISHFVNDEVILLDPKGTPTIIEERHVSNAVKALNTKAIYMLSTESVAAARSMIVTRFNNVHHI